MDAVADVDYVDAIFGRPQYVGRQAVAEMWLYPDGSRILELSTKCRPVEAFQVAAETRHYLIERGVPLGAVQQTKTKAALEYFMAQLAADRAATPAAESVSEG